MITTKDLNYQYYTPAISGELDISCTASTFNKYCAEHVLLVINHLFEKGGIEYHRAEIMKAERLMRVEMPRNLTMFPAVMAWVYNHWE